MTDERTDERLLRDWMTETVWLPESDLSGVSARIHRTPQHRGLLPPIDPGEIAGMLSATRLVLGGIVLVLVGSFLTAGLLNGGGEPSVAPGIFGPTGEPGHTPLAIAVPSSAPTEPSTPQAETAERPRRVHWEDGGVSFDARDFTITTRYGTYKPKAPRTISGYHDTYRTSQNGIPREAELEADWKQGAAWMRLRFELRSDGRDWWIHRIRTYDGHPGNGEYLDYPNLKQRTLTKLGQAYEGSLSLRPTKSERMTSVPGARLRIDDMRLTAFDLDAIPTSAPRAEYPRLIIDMAQTAMLKGQSQRVEAKWCLGESDCWPADDVRWSTDTPTVVKMAPTRGSWTQLTAVGPGAADLSYKGDRIQGSIGFEVQPRPGRDYGDFPATRWHLATPFEQVLKLGQYVVLTGWICPTKDAHRLGQDGQPGTADDECRTDDVRGLWLRPDSGLAEIGIAGPSAVLVASSFELEDDSLVAAWTGLWFDFGKGRDFGVSSLYVRDAQWRGPLLGDLDEDGTVNDDDVAIVTDALEASGPRIRQGADGWRKRLDLNVDHVIDEIDADILRLLAGAHSGEIRPVPAVPTPTLPPDRAAVVDEPQPSPSPEPSAEAG